MVRHGTSLCGLYHGFFLIIERIGFRKVLDRLPRTVARGYAACGAVRLGTVRAETLPAAIKYAASMFNFGNIGLVRASLQLDNITGFAIAIGIIFSAPLLPWLKKEA